MKILTLEKAILTAKVLNHFTKMCNTNSKFTVGREAEPFTEEELSTFLVDNTEEVVSLIRTTLELSSDEGLDEDYLSKLKDRFVHGVLKSGFIDVNPSYYHYDKETLSHLVIDKLLKLEE